jgi:thiol-disulfide isomerase/thioredoxin
MRLPVIQRSTAACALVLAMVALAPACSSGPPPPAVPAVPAVAKLDATLKDMDGREVRLADFKGRPLLINFWATYCGPCKFEIPLFVELVEKYREQKFTVLGISTDDSADDLKKFAAEYKMNYPVLLGLGHDELLEAYDAVAVIPVSWFIRPDGSVMLKHQGAQSRQWFEDQVRQLVAPVATAGVSSHD